MIIVIMMRCALLKYSYDFPVAVVIPFNLLRIVVLLLLLLLLLLCRMESHSIFGSIIIRIEKRQEMALKFAAYSFEFVILYSERLMEMRMTTQLLWENWLQKRNRRRI